MPSFHEVQQPLDFAFRTARALSDERAIVAWRGLGQRRASLTAGAAGIATYLAEVARISGEGWALDGARRWLREGRTLARRGRDAFGLEPARARGSESSLLVGRAGLTWAALTVADAAGDRGARARALALLRRQLAGARPSGDLVFGRAAFAEAGRELLATFADLDAQGAGTAAWMVRAGERCALRHARVELASAPLLPVAHGVAGMVLVLLGCPAHAAFARRRVEELAGLATQETGGLRGYPVRPGVAMGGFLGSWCNGVTGMLQLFLRAAQLGPPSVVLERALVESAITAARLRAKVPTLCCGSAGRALFLLDAAELLGEPALARRARALLASAMNRSRAEDPSAFFGQAGIAWVALAISVPGARRPLLFAVDRGRSPAPVVLAGSGG